MNKIPAPVLEFPRHFVLLGMTQCWFWFLLLGKVHKSVGNGRDGLANLYGYSNVECTKIHVAHAKANPFMNFRHIYKRASRPIFIEIVSLKQKFAEPERHFNRPIRKKEQAFLKKGKFVRQESNRPFYKKGCVFLQKTCGISTYRRALIKMLQLYIRKNLFVQFGKCMCTILKQPFSALPFLTFW